MIMAAKDIWTPAEKQAWSIPEPMTVSQCADRYRQLGTSSSEPGPWDTGRVPQMRAVMDAFSDEEVEEIDIMKPPQCSGTESVYNMMAYTILQDPGPSLLVMPRDDDCDYAAEDRLKPMVFDCPQLREHWTGRVWDLSTKVFRFDNMNLYFAGSNSPAALAAKPIRYLYLDEVNKYPLFIGKEANPIDLAIKRTTTFFDRKIVIVSTPTVAHGYITIRYKLSNMQQYYCPCPHCGEYSVWKFMQLKIPPKLRDPEQIRNNPYELWYECEYCAHKIREHHKAELVAAGAWVPEGQRIDAYGNLKGQPIRGKRVSGFNYTALISPWPAHDWAEIMASWFEANTEEGIAQGKLLDFKNHIEAVAFEETGKKITTAELKPLTGDYSKGTVPTDCVTLVAAADYHKSITRGIVRIDYEVRGFAPGLKNYLIASGSVSSFDQLDEAVLLEPFAWADGTSNEKKPWLAVMVMFVDAGYEPDDVYRYCMKRPNLTIPTIGAQGPCAKPLRLSDVESATQRRLNARQRKAYRGMQVVTIDTYYFKNQVHSWASPQVDEDGKILSPALTQFYAEVPAYYLREFSNEVRVKDRDRAGNIKWVWKPVSVGAATHSLDTAVGAAAAGFYKGVQHLRVKGQKRTAPSAARSKPKRKLSEIQRRKREGRR